MECKPRCDLEAEEIAAKHRDIRSLLTPRGVAFVEVTEHDMGAPALNTNINVLRRAGCIARLSRRRDGARALIAQHQPNTFGELQQLLGHEAGLHALAHGLAFFNIHQALEESTALMDQPNEDIDAAVFLYSRTAGASV